MLRFHKEIQKVLLFDKLCIDTRIAVFTLLDN